MRTTKTEIEAEMEKGADRLETRLAIQKILSKAGRAARSVKLH